MSDRPGGTEPRTTMDTLQADARRIADQAAGAMADAKAAAASKLDEVKDEGAGLLDAAREQAESVAEQGKERAAEGASAIAQAIHRIAGDLDEGAPALGHHVHRAADAADGIARALRERPLGELAADVAAFARRNPGAFFAVAAVAGFALARFVKSGTPASRGRYYAGPVPAAHRAPGWVAVDTEESRPATMAAATLGGAAAHRPADAQPGTMPQPPMAQTHVAPAGPATGQRLGTPLPNQRSGTPL